MLEEIIKDEVVITPASNQIMFDENGSNYEDLFKRNREYVEKWRFLEGSERKKYKNQQEFLELCGAPDLKAAELIPAKNYYMIKREAQERINKNDQFRLLPIDQIDFENTLIEIAESSENSELIQELYKFRKITTGNSLNAGINSDEAKRIKNCFSQARELFISGKNGSLMVKPLNFFYALTAYTYGVIILNNPLRFRKDMLPGSHGMSYLPQTIQAQFGGDSPRGTFSDLVTSFPTHLVKTPRLEFSTNSIESVTSYYKNRISVSIGSLLSLVPEMRDYYKLALGKSSRCYHLEISAGNDVRSLVWEFHLGDGEEKPSLDAIDTAFPGMPRHEKHGKIVVSVPAVNVSTIKACIYTDIRGQLWFIDNPFFPIILPEIAVHFLITYMFSNIMRYRPDEWGSVLANEVRSDISLLTRHYFSTLERKFLLMVIRCITKYFPFAADRT